MSSEPLLVGDVGGTKVRLALARSPDNHVQIDNEVIFDDPDIPDFETVIARYLDQIDETPTKSLFALAGPIGPDGSIKLTNRIWPRVEPAHIMERFGHSSCRIINDFTAMARAIPELPQAKFETIIESNFDRDWPVLVTGPGTGFGVSTLLQNDDGHWRVLSSEGGHAAFTPRTNFEWEVFLVMRRSYQYISNEMIVSGAWLTPVYRAVCEILNAVPEDLSAADMLRLADEGHKVCVEVCRFRANAIMGAVGDAALITGAQGGVVLTGGVAERIVSWLRAPEAVERFHNRGPMSHYLARTPVSVMTDTLAPLIGAAALHFGD